MTNTFTAIWHERGEVRLMIVVILPVKVIIRMIIVVKPLAYLSGHLHSAIIYQNARYKDCRGNQETRPVAETRCCTDISRTHEGKDRGTDHHRKEEKPADKGTDLRIESLRNGNAETPPDPGNGRQNAIASAIGTTRIAINPHAMREARPRKFGRQEPERSEFLSQGQRRYKGRQHAAI